jgi:hypothetical protein
MPQSVTANSWIRQSSSSGSLLYISARTYISGPGAVYIYSYPSGTLVGTLTGFIDPYGICSDKTGNVFVTDYGANDIVEFSHGGTSPIQTLADEDSPIGCSVDGKTGNLAVSNSYSTVSVFKKAQGNPQTYSVTFSPRFIGYDDDGNLFVVGSDNPFPVAELHKGASAFQSVTLDRRTRDFGPAGLQWNEGDLVLGSANPEQYGCCGKDFRFAISGSVGQQVGKHKVPGELVNFFINGSTIIVVTGGFAINVFDYPASKAILMTIKGPANSFGITISVAPTHSRVR